MAKSGTIIGSKSGTRPFLELDWSIDRQEVANNRSRVRLRLFLRVQYNIAYNPIYSGKLQGASFTSSAGYISSPGRYLLHERYVWINHNSDGTKKARLTAEYNLNITWSGTYHGKISLSGNASLDAIPRASTLSSGSIKSALKTGTANTLNLGISRKHSGFTHLVTILDGGTWVHDWGYGTQTPTSLTLSGTAVNRMLARMGSVTSKNFTLRLRTYSGSNGSGYIGESTRTIKATVDASVKPEINSTSASILGNSWAKNQGLYVQGQTGVRAEFSSSAVGGASVKSRNIKIGTTNGGSVVDGVFRHNMNTLNSSGTVTITYEITDSRNRKTTATRNITVQAYSPPRITSVTATRQSSDNTKVDVYRSGTTSDLGDKNQATLKIDYKRTTATSWTNLTSINFYGTFGATYTATNIPISASYDFRVTVTDKLGQSASSQMTVSTAKVLMSYNKDIGVGIGKIHERGALDVAGTVYMNGKVMALGGLGFEDTRSIKDNPQDIPSRAFSMAFKQAGAVDNPPERANSTYAHILNIAGWNSSEGSGGYPIQMSIGGKGISLRQGTSPTAWSPWTSLISGSSDSNPSITSGSNSNGRWIRFPDGTQICWNSQNHGRLALNNAWGSLYGNVPSTVNNFPVSFTSVPTVIKTITSSSHTLIMATVDPQPTRYHPGGFEAERATPATVSNLTTHYIAIGRWK